MPQNVSVLEKTASQLAESAHHASRTTCAIADGLIEDGVGVARRAVKRGGDAAEEFLDDTKQRVQRHPMVTVATTFAIAFTAGALTGWLIRRR